MEKAKAGEIKLAQRLPGAKEHALFWGIAAATIGLDLWTKHAVFAWMQTRGIWEYKLIDGLISLVMRENPGAAFGIAEGQRVVLIACALVAMAAIVAYFMLGQSRDRMTCLAMGLFMGGVIGNFYDRIFNNGLVRDFIDIFWRTHHWPAFNVADSALCIAVGVLMGRILFTGRPS